MCLHAFATELVNKIIIINQLPDWQSGFSKSAKQEAAATGCGFGFTAFVDTAYYIRIFSLWGDAEPVIDSFPDYPHNVIARKQQPGLFLIGERQFLVDKEIAEFLFAFQPKRDKPVAFFPFTQFERKLQFISIEAGNGSFTHGQFADIVSFVHAQAHRVFNVAFNPLHQESFVRKGSGINVSQRLDNKIFAVAQQAVGGRIKYFSGEGIE